MDKDVKAAPDLTGAASICVYSRSLRTGRQGIMRKIQKIDQPGDI